MLIIAGIVAATDDPGFVPDTPAARPGSAARSGRPMTADVNSGMTVGEAVRSPQFIILLLTNFFCCATHSGPIFHTVSYAMTCGIPMLAAVSIYSVEGLAGMGGASASVCWATSLAPSACW